MIPLEVHGARKILSEPLKFGDEPQRIARGILARWTQQECPQCRGTGKQETVRCRKCEGEGKVWKRR